MIELIFMHCSTLLMRAKFCMYGQNFNSITIVINLAPHYILREIITLFLTTDVDAVSN